MSSDASKTVFEKIKAGVPWYIKIPAKILLSRVPIHYDFWRNVGLFRHGAMDRPDYVLGVVRTHLERVGWPASLKPGFVALELGPGDSVASAIIMKAFGASRTYLVDTGDYATHDMEIYDKQTSYLCANGVPNVSPPVEAGFRDFLAGLNARYLTNGLQSFRTIPDSSIDFIWSQAVLEHVRRSDFDTTIGEFRRILAPGGLCSHRVDLSDHLGGALNNLRFSERVWESDFMATSGFYTNRIRFSEMIKIFRERDFSVSVIKKDLWSRLPTPRTAMADEYKSCPEEDLLVKGFDVLLS
jgi:SAM-dependent methyltransferase